MSAGREPQRGTTVREGPGVDVTRRRLLYGLVVGSLAWREVLAAGAAPDADRRIQALEVVKVEGRREIRGAHQQFQSHPSHVWSPPAEYREPADAPPRVTPVSALYVKLRTTGGLEATYGPIDHECVPVLLRDLAPWLAGRDPLAVEELWDRMYRQNRHGRAGHFMMAISAADNVLWDLRGRLLGLPVFRLLGGSRARVPVYASCLGFSLEPGRVEEKVRALKAEGYRSQKWFLAHGPAEGREGLLKNVALVRRTREAAGDDVDLMFDAFMGWDLPYALAWAKEAEPFRPRWIEEPFPPDRLESFTALREATSIPVASGEHLYARWEVERYLAARAIHVVQADPEWCGGTSELVRIATLASVHDAHVVPHGHALRSALHVIASQSPATCPMGECLLVKMVMREHPWYFCHFETEPLRIERGEVTLTESPGFGITLDPAKVETQERVRG
jgi:L-alanine-DL-glutamate epimerase-like enolase superfamily enzyme